MRPTEHHWLGQSERADVVRRLHELKLIKCDNGRSLPLKKGGTTDVYINLRDARSNPTAHRFVADLFVDPLRWLHQHGMERFAEIPDSVSGLASLISVKADIPYITIREEAKEGRVTKGKVIGEHHANEEVAIIDDVITDGASKIVPARTCLGLDLCPKTLVVLVDRQQGWRNLTHGDLPCQVWSGMTLHQVRQELIRAGLLQRCDPEREQKNPLILAFDNMEWDTMLPLLDVLRPTGTKAKVNDWMFENGFAPIDDIAVYAQVMVDLKLYDIPNTVGNVCRRLAKYRPWGVTVHASGGREMMRAAVKAFNGTPTAILAVTVLTSFDEVTCEEVYHRQPLEQVLTLAKLAVEAGVDGFVCSPEEVRALRAAHPQIQIFITPGVRSPGEAAGDQKRVATPREAMNGGATHIVGGRQFTGKPDPAAEVLRVLGQELEIAV